MKRSLGSMLIMRGSRCRCRVVNGNEERNVFYSLNRISNRMHVPLST
jgi:hypothetical protein